RERRGLAGAGLSGGEHVAACEDEGDGLRLDGSRDDVALLLDGLEEIGREAERIEGQMVSCVPDRGLVVRRLAVGCWGWVDGPRNRCNANEHTRSGASTPRRASQDT